MPLEMQDPDDDDSPRADWGSLGGGRSSGPRTPWWRPASTVGRFFLTLSALIVLGGLVTAGVLLKTYLERDAHFRIAGASDIQATGLTEVTRDEMLEKFGEDIGRNIFFVNLDERRRQLEEIPWVQRATVMRLLPDQIRVSVVERQPVAFTRQGQQIGLVDASGVLLSMPAEAMAKHHYSFPVLTGIDPGDPPGSRKARMGVYQRLIAELDANGQRLSEQISEIDLTDPEDARVLMPEQGADILAHFGDDRFLERFQRYKAHIAEWRQQYPRLSSVDLRYDQQVVLEMAPGANATDATLNGETASDGNASNPPQTNASPDAPPKRKPGLSANGAVKKAASTQRASAKPLAKAKKPKPGAHQGDLAKKTAPKPKTAAAKEKAAKDKKRAELQRAALSVSKRKPAPTTHPAVVRGQGQ
jgi:cell division protein FtsQ